jgi:hypothetical protein
MDRSSAAMPMPVSATVNSTQGFTADSSFFVSDSPEIETASGLPPFTDRAETVIVPFWVNLISMGQIPRSLLRNVFTGAG